MSLPSTGSLSRQAPLMLGSERKSARSRGSGDVPHKRSDDFREVASTVRDHPVTPTRGQAADKASDLDEITSHHPPSFLLLLALRGTFRHTAHRQSVVLPCLWHKNTSGTLIGEADISAFHTGILTCVALPQVHSMTCPDIRWRRTRR